MDNKKFILHRTVYDWLLEAIAFLGMAGTVIPACYMGKSANPIPVHFNFRGEPDAWGDASELEHLAIISIIFYILLTAIELPLSMALLTGLLIYYILKIYRLHNKA